MNHSVMVGKPTTNKKDEITGFTDVQTINANKAFGYNRRGYKVLEPHEVKMVQKAAKKAAKDPDVDEDDLEKLTVKELKVIAEPFGITAGRKADLIEAIEDAREAEAGE